MDVELSPSGPPETVLPEPPPDVSGGIASAAGDPAALATIVARHPASLAAWAALGESEEGAASDIAGRVAAYAAFRVGYHRGLDALRKNGWKGSGYVRSGHPGNDAFLRCLGGLSRMAGAIGEDDERDRCAEFLAMLDPGRPTAAS